MKQLIINIIACIVTIIYVSIIEHRNKHKSKNSDFDDIFADKMATVTVSFILFFIFKCIVVAVANYYHLT